MDGDLEDINEINSLREVRELFYQMRLSYRKMQQNARVQSRGGSQATGGLGEEQNAAEMARKETMAKGDGVGDEEEGKGFGIGIAPKGSKPTAKVGKKEIDPTDPEAEAQ